MSLSSEQLQKIRDLPEIEEIEIPDEVEVGYTFEFGDADNRFQLTFQTESAYQEMWVIYPEYATRNGRAESSSIISNYAIAALMNRGKLQVLSTPSFNFPPHKPYSIQSVSIGQITILVDKSPQQAETEHTKDVMSVRELLFELVSRALLAPVQKGRNA